MLAGMQLRNLLIIPLVAIVAVIWVAVVRQHQRNEATGQENEAMRAEQATQQAAKRREAVENVFTPEMRVTLKVVARTRGEFDTILELTSPDCLDQYATFTQPEALANLRTMGFERLECLSGRETVWTQTLR